MRSKFLFLLVTGIAAFGQAPAKLTFEVASIKPSAPPDASGRIFIGPPRGGPGTSDPGQINWQSAMLLNVVLAAYGKQNFEVTAPDWMATTMFDILVKVPEGATKEQVMVMWQNLLKDRFGMVVHHESKELPVQELTVAKGGAKLKDTDLPPNAEPFTPTPNPPKFDANGFPQMNGTGAITFINMTNGVATARTMAKGLAMPDFATRLGMMLRGRVDDHTGLTGRYDFTLEFTPDRSTMPPPPPGAAGPPAPAEASDPGTNIETALEKQLGLKLTKTKTPTDIVVVDHAEKTPTEN